MTYISKLTLYRTTHLLSLPLCPYRSGDLEGLPDLVIVASLLNEYDTVFSFGLAIVACSDKRWLLSSLYTPCPRARASSRHSALLNTVFDTFRESPFSACLGSAP